MAAANWRTLKKIDAHIHILPDTVHTANPDADDVWMYADLRQYVQIMRENHIERAVIMPFNDPFLMSMEFTAGAVHRNLAEMKRRYPGRFYAFADIDVRNSRAETVDALCRAIDDHALDGIKLHPNNSGLALDSDYNCAIFAFAQERRIPVAVHSYPNAEDDLSAAKRIVKTAERYPDLKLIVSHMGAFQWERLLPLACYVDLSAILPDYVRRYGVEGTNALLRKFGPKRLLFATDFPASRSLRPEEIYTVYCNGVQREHNKKLNNGLPILHKVPPKRDYGRYFCIMAEKGGTSHGGLTEKLSPFFHAKKQEVNAYGR